MFYTDYVTRKVELHTLSSFVMLEAVHKWRHLQGGKGVAKWWHYYISLYSKKGDKGEGGVKNLKMEVTSFVNGPLLSSS